MTQYVDMMMMRVGKDWQGKFNGEGLGGIQWRSIMLEYTWQNMINFMSTLVRYGDDDEKGKIDKESLTVKV